MAETKVKAKTKMIPVTLPLDRVSILEKQAKVKGCSLNAYCRTLLCEFAGVGA